MSTELATTEQQSKVKELSVFLRKRGPQLQQWAKNRVDVSDLMRFSLMDFSASQKLQECSFESIYFAVVACAQLGLAPGGIRQQAFIVPRAGQAFFELGYRGICELARRSGVRITANVVYDNDFFDHDLGSKQFVSHKMAAGERGEICKAYAIAEFSDGSIEIEIMDRPSLDKIRIAATHNGKESPAWKNWESEMYRKAPIKRLGKRLPLGDDFAIATRLDDMSQGRDQRGYNETLLASGVDIDVETKDAAPSRVSSLKEQLKGDGAK